MKGLLNLHRFLMDQMLYPILLSTILAVGIYAGRVYYSHQLNFLFLVWNLFLAWIPYLFSMLAAGLDRMHPRHGWLLLAPGAVWLAFFPNAPYLLTDFLHLRERYPVPLWYDTGLLVVFAWTGLFLAVSSLRTMQALVRAHAGRFFSWAFVTAVASLSGLGVYLGRFLRWNSWDLLFQPFSVLKDILVRLADPLSHRTFLGFTIMFTAFLLVCYLMFISVHPFHEPRDSEA
jgi:uncharacterized membrane protein